MRELIEQAFARIGVRSPERFISAAHAVYMERTTLTCRQLAHTAADRHSNVCARFQCPTCWYRAIRSMLTVMQDLPQTGTFLLRTTGSYPDIPTDVVSEFRGPRAKTVVYVNTVTDLGDHPGLGLCGVFWVPQSPKLRSGKYVQSLPVRREDLIQTFLDAVGLPWRYQFAPWFNDFLKLDIQRWRYARCLSHSETCTSTPSSGATSAT